MYFASTIDCLLCVRSRGACSPAAQFVGASALGQCIGASCLQSLECCNILLQILSTTCIWFEPHFRRSDRLVDCALAWAFLPDCESHKTTVDPEREREREKERGSARPLVFLRVLSIVYCTDPCLECRVCGVVQVQPSSASVSVDTIDTMSGCPVVPQQKDHETLTLMWGRTGFARGENSTTSLQVVT